MKRLYLTLIILCSFLTGYAQQLSMQFLPEIDGRNLQGLFNAKIINGSGTTYGALTIVVRKNNNSKLCEIRTKNFKINSGLNLLPADAVKSAKYQFANNKEGNLLAKAGVFPTGELEYCYTLTLINPVAEGSPESIGEIENCFDLDLMPLSPLSLSSPYDGEKICDIKPIFSWLPSLPVISGSQYKILCVKIKPGQSGMEALKYNLAMINSNGLQSPVFPFPANVRSLTSGDRYAWQVIQYASDVVINKSEVWMFEVGCEDMDGNSLAMAGEGNNYGLGEGKENEYSRLKRKKDNEAVEGDKEDTSVKASPSDLGYRDIEDLAKGNFYVAKAEIKFSIFNPYEERELRYEISCITDPNMKLDELKKIQLLNGKNKIQIQMADKKSLKYGYYYILKVWLPNGNVKSLRFVYKDGYE